MNAKYAQKNNVVQKASANTAESVVDSSSQSATLQRHASLAKATAQRAEAPRPNNTGMPDNLKAGIESLSGFSMDDVRVHYNSSKPATVQALAYTQGTDIHVAPGQEKHLPHEAWHVAQQMAGRVSPTTNINGMPVNDNAALEHEADVMGENAVKQTKMNDETKKIKNINPCTQMILDISLNQFIEGNKYLNSTEYAEKVQCMDEWEEVFLCKTEDRYKKCPQLKHILRIVKKVGMDATKIEFFRNMLDQLKKDVKANETSVGIEEDDDEQFQTTCQKAIDMCEKINDDSIRTYFGDSCEPDIEINFFRIKLELGEIKEENKYHHSYTSKNELDAYVRPNQKSGKHMGQIRLARGYRIAKNDGENSKPGILIHEASHIALGTHDYIYGKPGCLELCKTDVEKARANADSYLYAAEDSFLHTTEEDSPATEKELSEQEVEKILKQFPSVPKDEKVPPATEKELPEQEVKKILNQFPSVPKG